METYYKLTDATNKTHEGCQWGPGVMNATSGEGDLCGPGWTHWYTDPLLAVMLNSIHGTFDLATAHLWRGHNGPSGVVKTNHGLKVGLTRGVTDERIELPVVSLTQKIAFGILCALQVRWDGDASWRAWGEQWLSGEDRTRKAIATANAAAGAAADAAYAAGIAADANAANAIAAAYAAANAANATAYAAANAAAYAAYAAATAANAAIDLIAIARKAMLVKENS